MTKRLVLLRHAKSSHDDPELDDHDRPLADRGRRAAERMGDHIREEELEPALVICSSARRAVETLDLLALTVGVPVEVEDEVYAAGGPELLERLRRVPDTVGSVMLVGHNPAVQDLAVSLAGSGRGRARLGKKYPTAALAILALPGEWGKLRPGGAELTAFVKPKDLE